MKPYFKRIQDSYYVFFILEDGTLQDSMHHFKVLIDAIKFAKGVV